MEKCVKSFLIIKLSYLFFFSGINLNQNLILNLLI